MSEFEKRLAALLNEFSMENASNTPDFLLADYLINCLNSWNACVVAREQWYGRMTSVPETQESLECVDPPG